jgi:hypothetical protein
VKTSHCLAIHVRIPRSLGIGLLLVGLQASALPATSLI